MTGMNVEQARFNMVEQQIRTWEVLDQGVLDLLFELKREEFVPAPHRALAFADLELPLTATAGGPKMWAPKMEARALQSLNLKGGERVLEIGTGSGYLTALLARKAGHVVSIEIDPELHQSAATTLRRHGIANVTLKQGDGARGWPADQPYDAIVLTGSTPLLPNELFSQLRGAGRIFAVVGEAPAMLANLYVQTAPGAVRAETLFETVIDPLVNAAAPQRFVF